MFSHSASMALLFYLSACIFKCSVLSRRPFHVCHLLRTPVHNLAPPIRHQNSSLWQVGRAGRDGERATCTTLVSAADLPLLRSMIYGGTPSEGAVRGLLKAVFAGGDDEADFNFYDLSQVRGIEVERQRDIAAREGAGGQKRRAR